jgi:excisionase family DNA binding protein
MKIYSVKEASEKLGIEASYLRRLLENGVVKGQKLGHDWVVLSLDYKRKRKIGGGRKKKNVTLK